MSPYLDVCLRLLRFLKLGGFNGGHLCVDRSTVSQESIFLIFKYNLFVALGLRLGNALVHASL
jgi:hypothetical protein